MHKERMLPAGVLYIVLKGFNPPLHCVATKELQVGGENKGEINSQSNSVALWSPSLHHF